MKTNKLKQQKGTLLRVLQYVKPYRVLVIVSLLCACVSAAAQLLIPILTGKAIDQMIGAGQVNLQGVLVFAVWIAVVAALSAVAQQFLATSNNKIAYNISRDLRNAAAAQAWRISTHAPRTGSDSTAYAGCAIYGQFQPTLPARGATWHTVALDIITV